MDTLRLHATVERKSLLLPRYCVVPGVALADWCLTGTTPVQVAIDGTPVGRRQLKRWGPRDERWFVDLTEDNCLAADVDTGSVISLVLSQADQEPPAELEELLASNADAQRAFEALSLAARRQLSEHVRAAKLPATRSRRARRALLGDDRVGGA